MRSKADTAVAKAAISAILEDLCFDDTRRSVRHREKVDVSSLR